MLRQEIINLLTKRAVPPSERESGYYSRYFVVPKKYGGLCPVLDLRPINHSLYKLVFKMTTLKQILAQIRPGDWFVLVDLKNTYFHIQIAPRHRCFLRFTFEGTAYQFTVMPFGLALAPRIFTKCVYAALSPLRASRIRIFKYLDFWLVLEMGVGNAWKMGRARVVVTHRCLNALKPWRNPDLYQRGICVWSRGGKVVTIDASTAGWGAHCNGVLALGYWTESEKTWHINCLEHRTVFLALQSFII